MTTALKVIKAAQGCARSFAFRILTEDGTYRDMTGWTVRVKVASEAGVLAFGPTDCPVKSGDATTRVVTVEGTATATAGWMNGCVEWTDLAGKTDALPFKLEVYSHA